jgi:chondroitin-sulfate-ABC endolyase/exolyase
MCINGTLSMSKEHYKLESESMKWEFQASGSIEVTNPVGVSTALTTYKGGLMLWIYNETPIDDKIKFEYSHNGTVYYWFDYNINFKGWRACWIRFDEDMKGPKVNNTISKLTITAPSTAGALYFDRYVYPDTRIHDRVTGDAQLPDINPEISYHNHWGALWHWYTYAYDLGLTTATSEELMEVDRIRARLINKVQGTAPSASSLSGALSTISSYNIIVNTDKSTTGSPYVSDDEYDSEYGDITMAKAGELMYTLARAYYHDQTNYLARENYFKLYDHIIDQGLCIGSAMGSNHHYGYSFEKMSYSFILMYDYMCTRRKQKLLLYHPHFEYWAAIQEFRKPVMIDELQETIDAWLTLSLPRLIAAVTHPDENEQVRSLKGLQRWYNSSLKHASGYVGGLKEDGSVFHHGGLYPAYGIGGLTSLGEVLHILRDTPFQLNDESRLNIKKSLMTMRFYSNRNDWGMGLCGRHPLTGTISSGVHKAFYYAALLGNTETGENIDKDLANACLRLTSDADIISDLTSKGYSAEASPVGFKEINRAALGLFRKDDWLVTLKGFNKHVWSTEIYSNSNLYGRYQSYATLQITGINGAAASGYLYNGWDWNRAPGATSIQLSYDELNLFAYNPRGEERFAGASSFDGNNGMFAMVLNEHNLNKYTPDHMAYISRFCFGKKIICLGSGISNSNTSNTTETTIFQYGLQSQSTPVIAGYTNEGLNRISDFPYQNTFAETKGKIIMDPSGNGYYLPADVNYKMIRQNQSSPHDKTKVINSGDFALAIIEHGNAPSNAKYHYVVMPYTTQQEISDFAISMENTNTEAYSVLQHDNTAHIVKDKETGITAYSIFNVNTGITHGIVKSVDQQCMIMYKENSSTEIALSICNPDLNLMQEASDIVPNSKPLTYHLTVKGGWNVKSSNGEIRYLSHQTNGSGEIESTTFEVTSVKGKTINATIEQSGTPTTVKNETDAQDVNIFIDKTESSLKVRNIPASAYSIEMYSVTGKVVSNISPLNKRQQLNISMNQYPKGIYIVRINCNNGNNIIEKVLW